MKQILVDMDGVLADVYSQFILMEYDKYGIKIDVNTLNGKLESENFPHYDMIVRNSGFFRTAPVMPGSIGGIKYLNSRYHVLVVSSATEFPDSLKEKLEWLNEFYPFISWKQMIFCGEKHSIKGDIMLDDHPKNLDFLSFMEGAYLFFLVPKFSYSIKKQIINPQLYDFLF